MKAGTPGTHSTIVSEEARQASPEPLSWAASDLAWQYQGIAFRPSPHPPVIVAGVFSLFLVTLVPPLPPLPVIIFAVSCLWEDLVTFLGTNANSEALQRDL